MDSLAESARTLGLIEEYHFLLEQRESLVEKRVRLETIEDMDKKPAPVAAWLAAQPDCPAASAHCAVAIGCEQCACLADPE